MNDSLEPVPLGTAELGELVAAVGVMPASVDDAERIDRVRHFEQLKSAIAAAQACETAAFVASQRAAQAAAGVPPERRDRGIASQLALARRISLHAAQRYAGWAAILVHELPETLTELRAGRTNEHRALTIARETIFLSRDHRATVDRDLAPRLEPMSDRAVEVHARQAGYRLDPEGSLARTRRAIGERHISIRPAPDTMVRISGLLPVAQGVACYAALSRHADTARSSGDPRSRSHVMADTFTERLTGQSTADAVPIDIELIVSSDTLFAHPDQNDADRYCPPEDGTPENDGTPEKAESAESQTDNRHDGDTAATETSDADTAPAPRDEPALITAPGLTPMPIPAALARDLVLNAPRAWLRRLFTRPDTGELVAMQTHRRLFTDNQKHFIRHRDQYCVTPWCGAPIRHADHITPAARGGRTTLTNGRGLCQACNHALQASGWRSTRLPDGAIETITPTGHIYLQPPPEPFMTGSPPDLTRERLRALQRAGRLEPAA